VGVAVSLVEIYLACELKEKQLISKAIDMIEA